MVLVFEAATALCAIALVTSSYTYPPKEATISALYGQSTPLN